MYQSFDIDTQEAMEDPLVTETDYFQTAAAAFAGGLLGGISGPLGRSVVRKLGRKKTGQKRSSRATAYS